jgi:hypothetical protein
MISLMFFPEHCGAPGDLRHFRGECCFQVIYFVSNISSLGPIKTSPAPGAETFRSKGRG